MKRFLPVITFVIVAIVLCVFAANGVISIIKYVAPGILCPDLPESGFEEIAVSDSVITDDELPPKGVSASLWTNTQTGQAFRGENSLLGGDEEYLRPVLDNEGNPVGFRKVNNLEPAEPGKPRHTTIWENIETQELYTEKKDIFGQTILSRL